MLYKHQFFKLNLLYLGGNEEPRGCLEDEGSRKEAISPQARIYFYTKMQ